MRKNATSTYVFIKDSDNAILYLCVFQNTGKNITKSVKSNREASITYRNNPLTFLEF